MNQPLVYIQLPPSNEIIYIHTHVWVLINIAAVTETMKMNSPQETDYRENRIPWCMPLGNNYYLREVNLACIPSF